VYVLEGLYIIIGRR